MKSRLVSLIAGLGLLASGCGFFDVYRDRQVPEPAQSQPHTRQAVPSFPSELPALPPITSPGVEQMPPYWYWADKQQQQFDRYSQQQRNFYQQNRTPPPQFQRPLNCQSIQMGGQIVTNCY